MILQKGVSEGMDQRRVPEPRWCLERLQAWILGDVVSTASLSPLFMTQNVTIVLTIPHLLIPI